MRWSGQWLTLSCVRLLTNRCKRTWEQSKIDYSYINCNKDYKSTIKLENKPINITTNTAIYSRVPTHYKQGGLRREKSFTSSYCAPPTEGSQDVGSFSFIFVIIFIFKFVSGPLIYVTICLYNVNNTFNFEEATGSCDGLFEAIAACYID